MKQEKPVRELLAVASKAIHANRDFGLRMQRESRERLARQSRAGQRFRERLLRRALAPAGIELELIEKQHRRNDAALEKFAKQQKQSIVARSKEIVRQQAVELEKAAGHVDGPGLSGLQEVLRLDRVTAIEIAAQAPGSAKQGSTSPMQNLVRGVVRATSSWNANQEAMVISLFHFSWTSDRDGLLVATSQVWPNVGWMVQLESACIAHCRAEVAADAQILASQVGAGDQLQQSISAVEPFVARTLEGTCHDGAVEGNIRTAPVALASPNPIPIVKGRPVLATVSVITRACAFNGSAEVNFEQGALRINVPFVDLFLFT